jgi:riboflavin kinase/FMN adenylyltransferase
MIRVFHDWSGIPPEARGASVALGNFDGMHRGHVEVLRAAHAARPDAPRAALTFAPHPREFFRPDDPPFRLMLEAERAAALEAEGIEILYELTFDRAFSLLSAEAFIEEVLDRGIGAAHLACGADFAFGHRRGGGVAMLRAAAGARGIGLSIVPHLDDAEGPISSSRIRRLLQDGYPERAAALLGRPHAIRGVVAHGDARGRTIGFPAANVALGRHLEPARGVYAVTVRLADGRMVKGVANIGRRPTVAEGAISRLEAHLFDFSGDLYGQEITVSLHRFIRDERRFASVDELRAQIAADADEARRLLTTV